MLCVVLLVVLCVALLAYSNVGIPTFEFYHPPYFLDSALRSRDLEDCLQPPSGQCTAAMSHIIIEASAKCVSVGYAVAGEFTS